MSEDSKYCEWKQDDSESNIWQGECGMAFILESGTPDENDMIYCPKCGKLVRTIILIELEEMEEIPGVSEEWLDVQAELIAKYQTHINGLQVALQLLLDHIDYTNGACAPNEMIAGVLPISIITKAKEALKKEDNNV